MGDYIYEIPTVFYPQLSYIQKLSDKMNYSSNNISTIHHYQGLEVQKRIDSTDNSIGDILTVFRHQFLIIKQSFILRIISDMT